MKTFTKQITNRMNIYVVIVLTSGILSLFLQSLSLVTWGWLQINFDTKTVTPSVNVQSKGTIKVSLWQIESCDEETVNSTTNATCATTSKSELGKMLTQMQGQSGQQQDGLQDTEARQASIDVVFGDFDILPYLAVTALCSSIFGLAVFLFQFSSCCSKAKIRVEIVSMMFWLIAVGVLVATVSIGGHLNSFLSNIYKMVSSMDLSKKFPPGVNISLKMSVSFPYSVMLSGIGMAFCFINTAAIVVDICVTKFKRSTDYWKYGRVHLSEDHEKVELMSDVE